MSLATSFAPLAGIGFAILLLGEDPGAGFIPGGLLILLAIHIGQSKTPTGQQLGQAARQLRRAWAGRPTFTPDGAAQALVPVAALMSAPRHGYTGSY